MERSLIVGTKIHFPRAICDGIWSILRTLPFASSHSASLELKMVIFQCERFQSPQRLRRQFRCYPVVHQMLWGIPLAIKQKPIQVPNILQNLTDERQSQVCAALTTSLARNPERGTQTEESQ
jgi:hypothetical protein